MLTPPQIAKQLSVGHDKVMGWIRSGELAAFNAASNPNGQPRYRVSQEALDAFMQRRAAGTAKLPNRQPTCPGTSSPGVKDYYAATTG
jgi:excisionase family DNA binding protein